MTLDTEVRKFAKLYKKPADHPNGATGAGDASWDQDCAAFIYRFGLFVAQHNGRSWSPRVTGPTAYDVQLASGSLHQGSGYDVGDIVWFNARFGSKRPGHVGVVIRVNGKKKIAMATYAISTALAPALGWTTVAGYVAKRPWMKYVGFSRTYAGATFPTLSTASVGGTKPVPIKPAPKPEVEYGDMRRLIKLTGNPPTFDMMAESGLYHESISYAVALLVTNENDLKTSIQQGDSGALHGKKETNAEWTGRKNAHLAHRDAEVAKNRKILAGLAGQTTSVALSAEQLQLIIDSVVPRVVTGVGKAPSESKIKSIIDVALSKLGIKYTP